MLAYSIQSQSGSESSTRPLCDWNLQSLPRIGTRWLGCGFSTVRPVTLSSSLAVCHQRRAHLPKVTNRPPHLGETASIRRIHNLPRHRWTTSHLGRWIRSCLAILRLAGRRRCKYEASAGRRHIAPCRCPALHPDWCSLGIVAGSINPALTSSGYWPALQCILLPTRLQYTVLPSRFSSTGFLFSCMFPSYSVNLGL